MPVYRCNNCLWEGTSDDMDVEGNFFLCPNCEAVFIPNDDEPTVWSKLEDEAGDE